MYVCLYVTCVWVFMEARKGLWSLGAGVTGVVSCLMYLS